MPRRPHLGPRNRLANWALLVGSLLPFTADNSGAQSLLAGTPSPEGPTTAEPASKPIASLKQYNLVEEGGPFDPGTWQIEQDVGYVHRTKGDRAASSYAGVSQISYFPDDRWQLTLLGATYTYTDDHPKNHFVYDGSGGQLHFTALSPESHPVGITLFQEVVVGPQNLTTDSRAIFTVIRRDWNLTYNLRLANEVDGLDGGGGGTTTTGTLGNYLGVAHTWDAGACVHQISLGAELSIDTSWLEWRRYQDTLLYAGPTLALTFAQHWTLTLTAAHELTDVPGQPRFQAAAALIFTF